MSASRNEEACVLIERAGGSAALSRLTGYSVQRVNNWKLRGIPSEAKVRFPHLLWPAGAAQSSVPPVPGSSAGAVTNEGTTAQVVA